MSAREFRNWLRGFVTRHMGKPLTTGAAKALGPLNELLAGDTSYPVVEAAGGEQALRLRRVRHWEGPNELLRPIAEAAADLVCSVDFRLIRACEGFPCTLVFLDRTKAHIRRWCSMAVCGNRAKAAAHRAKKRSPVRWFLGTRGRTPSRKGDVVSSELNDVVGLPFRALRCTVSSSSD